MLAYICFSFYTVSLWLLETVAPGFLAVANNLLRTLHHTYLHKGKYQRLVQRCSGNMACVSDFEALPELASWQETGRLASWNWRDPCTDIL